MTEPKIQIDDYVLAERQAAALRMIVSGVVMEYEMTENELDEFDKTLLTRAREILKILLSSH